METTYTQVPVLINFFNRPEPLKKVFAAVRSAKPKMLFLSQDGPREGNATDTEKVAQCREVVSQIDWDCQVYHNYSQVNLGCGRRMSSAITWAFTYVDRLMILEDDCVPGELFFPFAQELLERYKDDTRISMIAAMNHLGTCQKETDSYLFCNSGAIWAWATWKRQWELYDFEMRSMEPKDVLKKIRSSNYPRYYKRDLIAQAKDRYAKLRSGQKLSSWTFQFNILRFLNHQLTIVPRVNLMSNVGLSSESTHAVSSLQQIPKGLQSIFYMKAGRLAFPLQHPRQVYCNDAFDRAVWRKLGMPLPIAIYRKLAGICRQFVYGDKKKLFRKLKKKLLG